MPDLTRELRRSLENTIKAARVSAETGAEEALRRLGVGAAVLPAHMEARRAERNRLRAHARSLGDALNKDDTQETKRLAEAAAYVQWHRLLFARFLVERGLLRDEDGIVVSLADCREEAAMAGAGDEWSVAAGHAARLLPGVFPPDDPVESLVLAPEHGKALRDHLKSLSSEIFLADDSLGWTYQFWRAAEKKAINESQGKIGATELPAMTQLFTEPYMVRFLLHNTLGAWWAGKVLADRPEFALNAVDEAALRAACAVSGYDWDYLRFVQEDGVWRPAAGVFPGWPVRAAEITVLDPCCGSGHFLTEVLAAIAAVRVAEERLSPAEAVVAVLRENLHGLEIDGRCVQIAAFNLALVAWRIGGAGVLLPTPHVAWVGAPPPLPKSEFAALANGDLELRRGLEALHDLFSQAPLLGSLIEPTGGDLINPSRIARIEESIEALVEKMRVAEPDRLEGALAALGLSDAAAMLTRKWVLISTNVPFLGYRDMSADLVSWVTRNHPQTKGDLGYCLWRRLIRCSKPGGAIAIITLQHWRSTISYEDFREQLLTQESLGLVTYLGTGAFRSISGKKVNVTLTISSTLPPQPEHLMAVLDCNPPQDADEKAQLLLKSDITTISQKEQLSNPAHTILFHRRSISKSLHQYAWCLAGVMNGDSPRFIFQFWEVRSPKPMWTYLQSTVDKRSFNGGRDKIIFFDDVGGHLREDAKIRRDRLHNSDERGNQVWGSVGIAVNQMADLSINYYYGSKYDSNVAVIVPLNPADTLAIAAFCTSPSFSHEVRKIEQKLNITNATFGRLPFDLAHWSEIAKGIYPNGIPEPHSHDPTQWLFHGHPRQAESGTELHVALARLAGYRWPAETDPEMRLSSEARAIIAKAATLPAPDTDGLLALVPARAERALGDRLLTYLAACWGDAWRVGMESELITAACERAKEKPPAQLNLNAWLRSHAARQHAKLFHERPFLWWITDGRTDGFTAVVNYHRLNRTNLERLTYTVLGDWIARLGDDSRQEAARVLQVKLAKILEGEKPHDIFVRWKRLDQQPLGWEPDLDDGVRLNIRPFIEARILSHEPNVKYGVDRGTDVKSAPWFNLFEGKRLNDHHTTLAEKHAARAKHAAA